MPALYILKTLPFIIAFPEEAIFSALFKLAGSANSTKLKMFGAPVRFGYVGPFLVLAPSITPVSFVLKKSTRSFGAN